MHQDLDVDYFGAPDIDFVRGMIPHHQGAIDMAGGRHAVRHGLGDPELRREHRCGAGVGDNRDAGLARAAR